MRKTIVVAAASAVIASAATATATTLITSSMIANGTIRGIDIRKGTISIDKLGTDLQKQIRASIKAQGAPGEANAAAPVVIKGDTGAAGAPGIQGGKGDAGKPAETVVSALSADLFEAYNTAPPTPGFDPALAQVTPDGLAFGPYADGGSQGSGVRYKALDGQPLSALKSTSFTARYSADQFTSGSGAPYWRVGVRKADNTTDVLVFSPGEQPSAAITEGEFHTYVPTSGLLRSSGNGGAASSGMSTFREYLAANPGATINGAYGIRLNVGFTQGANLRALIRTWEVNGTAYRFAG